MHQHIWYKKLRELNPKLRVCQFENSKHLPGVYYVDEREGIVDVCATDISWVPARPKYNTKGMMVKSGYRRVVHILLHMNLTTPAKVRKVFPGFFESHYPNPSPVQARSIHKEWSAMMQDERQRLAILGAGTGQVDVTDPIVDKMKRMELDNHYRRGSAALSGEQYLELSDDVKDQMTDDQIKNLDEAKFNYDKAVGKRKTII